MKLLLSAAAAALLVSAAPAFAQDAPLSESYYGTIGYTQYSGESQDDDIVSDVDFGAATVRVGGRFGRFLGVELEGQLGTNDSDIEILGEEGSIGLEYSGAIYGVVAFPVSPNAEIFGRVGVGTAELKLDILGEEAGGDETFTAYGIGGSYFFDGRNGVRAEYTALNFGGDDDSNEADLDSFSISYVRRFGG